jgi:hypothetical protein
VTSIEDRLDAGHEAAARMLHDDLGPHVLRTRLLERP